MIEIKKDNLIIDDKTMLLEDINMIQSAKGKLYFSNKIVEISQNAYGINDVYGKLMEAGLTGFVMIDNVIVNIQNVESAYIKYYQYVGLSIIQSNKENADIYMVVMNCKDGRSETISYGTPKDAEKTLGIINAELTKLESCELQQ